MLSQKRFSQIIGNVVRKVETKVSKSDKDYAHLTIATSDWINQQQITNFFTILCFNKAQIEYLKNLEKGDLVAVTANLNSSTDKDGKINSYAFDLVLESVTILKKISSKVDSIFDEKIDHSIE